MLYGSTPEEAFFVQCDDETNAPDDVDRGMMTTRIGLAVTRPVEVIVFRVTQRLEDQAQQDEEESEDPWQSAQLRPSRSFASRSRSTA